jgi:hypothetical protein
LASSRMVPLESCSHQNLRLLSPVRLPDGLCGAAEVIGTVR